MLTQSVFECVLAGLEHVVVEALVFGTVGYFICRAIFGKQNKWYVEVVGLTLLLTLDMLWADRVFRTLDISIGNLQFLEWFGGEPDIWGPTDVYDLVIGFAQVTAGYFFGRYLRRRIGRIRVAEAPIR